jgi:riboflavin synthase
MFTGIIEEKGVVEGLSAAGSLKVKASRVLEGTRPGDSIAVMGVCLTVVEMGPSAFTVDVMPETLRSSTLGELRPGSVVNLERAMSAGGRFGGHMVNGHVDGVGTVSSIRRESNAVVVEVTAAEELTRYMVRRGSVALDGISLTLVEASRGRFTVSIIPHTLEETALDGARPGTRVNVEVDIMAKYVEAFLAGRGGEGRGGIEEALSRGGYTAPGQEM